MGNKVTLSDISLSEFTLHDELQDAEVKKTHLKLIENLRTQHFATRTEVCIERAKYITEYMKNKENAGDPPEITRAKAIRHYMANRDPIFHDDNLLAGSTTSKRIGAPLYPELLGMTIWPELDTISSRPINPQILSDKDAELCNLEIFPYWIDRTVLEVTRKRLIEQYGETPDCLRLMEKIVFYISGKAGCISHCIPSYEKVLHKGMNSIIEEANQKTENLRAGDQTESSREKINFYESVRISMEGVIAYANNLSGEAKKRARQETDAVRKKNFETIANICRQVPAGPARTYREAVNSLWLCQVGIHAENINMAMSPGRLDQVLYPFFRKDVENGLSLEEVLNISCCLWLKIADNTNLVPETAERLWGGAGSTPAVTFGGIDMEGKDAVNDLTYVLLKTTELMALRDPSVNARYNYEVNTQEYRDRVSDVIIKTKAIPAFHNDVADINTLMNQGESIEHARDFGIVGCVELASTGRDYGASSSIMLNLSAAMEMTLYNGKRPITGEEQIGPLTGDPANFNSFDQFWEAFKIQLKSLIEKAIELNEHLGRTHQEMLATPLLSAFFEGPMESGKDLVFGGALYNSSGASHVAFPDVCDSLNAIEFAVFREKKLSMRELVSAVKSNFTTLPDAIYGFIKNRVPRFGEEHEISLKNSRNLIEFIYDVYQSHTNYRGGSYRPAYWTMTTHAGQGRLAEALPSGRKSTEVFSSGITPASQAAKELTAAYNSVAALPGKCIPGGQALNIKYTPPPESGGNNGYLKKFGDMVEAYFRDGGLQVQFNIQTYEDLIAAKKDPDKYPEMIVRVSGYSAYFKDLSDPMKDELITRTQYDLVTGKAVPLPENFNRKDAS